MCKLNEEKWYARDVIHKEATTLIYQFSFSGPEQFTTSRCDPIISLLLIKSIGEPSAGPGCRYPSDIAECPEGV